MLRSVVDKSYSKGWNRKLKGQYWRGLIKSSILNLKGPWIMFLGYLIII